MSQTENNAPAAPGPVERRVRPQEGRKEGTMIYEEAIVEGVLCWRNSPRDCKGHGDWIPKTPQELTAMLMESRRASAVIPPMRPHCYGPGVVVQPVVSPPQPLAIPDYQNPPWTVTC